MRYDNLRVDWCRSEDEYPLSENQVLLLKADGSTLGRLIHRTGVFLDATSVSFCEVLEEKRTYYPASVSVAAEPTRFWTLDPEQGLLELLAPSLISVTVTDYQRFGNETFKLERNPITGGLSISFAYHVLGWVRGIINRSNPSSIRFASPLMSEPELQLTNLHNELALLEFAESPGAGNHGGGSNIVIPKGITEYQEHGYSTVSVTETFRVNA